MAETFDLEITFHPKTWEQFNIETIRRKSKQRKAVAARSKWPKHSKEIKAVENSFLITYLLADLC